MSAQVVAKFALVLKPLDKEKWLRCHCRIFRNWKLATKCIFYSRSSTMETIMRSLCTAWWKVLGSEWTTFGIDPSTKN